MQLQALCHSSAADVEDALVHLPLTLHETYERILQSFSSTPAIIARIRRVFESVAFTTRPLSLDEVVEIYRCRFDSASDLIVDGDISVDDYGAFLLRKCPGLLEVVDKVIIAPDHFQLDAYSDISYKAVEFIHFSAIEYLLSQDLAALGGPVSDYGFTYVSAQATLATICIGALDPVHSLSLPHLQTYARHSWFEHVWPGPVAEKLEPVLTRFLDPTSPAFSRAAGGMLPYVVLAGSPMHWAVLRGLASHVKRLLNDGIDVNSRDRIKRTPLHLAIRRRSEFAEIMEILHEHGADLDAEDGLGTTPLHMAIYERSVPLASLLLDWGANIHIPDIGGSSPLHLAASMPNSEMVKLLLERGALLSIEDKCGDTVLHSASAECYFGSILLILEWGADVNARNRDGATPLHKVACGIPHYTRYGLTSRDSLEVATLLLACGASVHAIDINGHTPLYDFCAAGNVEIARLLLERGARVDTRTRNGRTPLDAAGMRRYTDGDYDGVIQLLVAHGASLELAAPPPP